MHVTTEKVLSGRNRYLSVSVKGARQLENREGIKDKKEESTKENCAGHMETVSR
jgi:hypothetical protein